VPVFSGQLKTIFPFRAFFILIFPNIRIGKRTAFLNGKVMKLRYIVENKFNSLIPVIIHLIDLIIN